MLGEGYRLLVLDVFIQQLAILDQVRGMMVPLEPGQDHIYRYIIKPARVILLSK